MQEEIAAVYKTEGVNPAGGCLPMLIQFPFLIAYYRMLGVALDLRHAHWLWITIFPRKIREPVADTHGGQHVRHATHDSASRHGRAAAENAAVDDAADDGLIFFNLQAD